MISDFLRKKTDTINIFLLEMTLTTTFTKQGD